MAYGVGLRFGVAKNLRMMGYWVADYMSSMMPGLDSHVNSSCNL